MTKQTINQGAAPTGAGGDTFRTGSAKLQANDDELYNYLGDGVNLNKLGTAAFKYAGTSAGNVMEVGAFGLGAQTTQALSVTAKSLSQARVGFYADPTVLGQFIVMGSNASNYKGILGVRSDGHIIVAGITGGVLTPWYTALSDRNTVVDGNGFVKKASPIVNLFADRIELNEEAQQQNIMFEKLGIGDYLIKGSTGFAQESWYIEMPKDANGNVLVAVVYEQLEDQTIEVKTFAKKFDEETGDIVPNLEKPRDIPSGRWIDIRLKALPQPEIEISKTPADFQPTNLAQAVKEALKNDSEQ